MFEQETDTKPTPELVRRKAAQTFPEMELNEVMAVLDDYGSEYYHQERERVQLGVLKSCGGDLVQLRQLMQTAREDFRDILCWAEYRRECELPFKATKEENEQARNADRAEYVAWLESYGEALTSACSSQRE